MNYNLPNARLLFVGCFCDAAARKLKLNVRCILILIFMPCAPTTCDVAAYIQRRSPAIKLLYSAPTFERWCTHIDKVVTYTQVKSPTQPPIAIQSGLPWRKDISALFPSKSCAQCAMLNFHYL